MKVKKITAGQYEYLGHKVIRVQDGLWIAYVEGEGESNRQARTLKGVLEAVGSKMVTRRNIQSGKDFQERLDTPYYCSPSSETYWSS